MKSRRLHAAIVGLLAAGLAISLAPGSASAHSSATADAQTQVSATAATAAPAKSGGVSCSKDAYKQWSTYWVVGKHPTMADWWGTASIIWYSQKCTNGGIQPDTMQLWLTPDDIDCSAPKGEILVGIKTRIRVYRHTASGKKRLWSYKTFIPCEFTPSGKQFVFNNKTYLWPAGAFWRLRVVWQQTGKDPADWTVTHAHGKVRPKSAKPLNAKTTPQQPPLLERSAA